MQLATIVWFDATSGKGEVETTDGEALFLHFTSIAGVAKNNWQWPTNDDQQRLRGLAGLPCLVSVYRNLYSARVDACEVDV